MAAMFHLKLQFYFNSLLPISFFFYLKVVVLSGLTSSFLPVFYSSFGLVCFMYIFDADKVFSCDIWLMINDFFFCLKITVKRDESY